MSKWYAVFVKTGEERNTRDRIEYRLNGSDLKTVLPMRSIKEYRKDGHYEEVVRPLYPGYVLLNGILEVEQYYSLKNIPGIIKLIRDKSGPIEIPPEEIAFIARLLDGKENIGISKAFYEGEKIKITDGPLKGLEGLIKSVDRRKKRVKISTSFLGKEKIVELGVEFVIDSE